MEKRNPVELQHVASFLFLNQGHGPQRGSVYPTVLRCVLCVCDLWLLLVKKLCHVACFLDGTRGKGGVCLFSTLCCTTALIYRKNWFQIEILDLNPCCLQLTVKQMMMMKPVEKFWFWTCLLKQKNDLLNHCSRYLLVSTALSLVVCVFFLLPRQSCVVFSWYVVTKAVLLLWDCFWNNEKGDFPFEKIDTTLKSWCQLC